MEKKPLIKFNKLCKNYGEVRAVSNLDFEVFEGEIFGFIGPNGAGKSTTIRTMLNFLFPTSGAIEIFGLDCVNNSSTIKNDIGYVPSEVNYYDYMKVQDLLDFASSFYDSVDSKWIDQLCKDFKLDRNRKIRELSFGNKKKVSIVQALLSKPKLLILDEPTNGLDPLMQQKLFEVLGIIKNQGTTIFLSSHNLNEVEKYCDRVGIIRDGIIVDVKDVSKLNRQNIKKVIISTPKKIKFKTKGINNMRYINNELYFSFEGNIKDLLLELANQCIDDVAILPLTLEEDFLRYYGK